MAQLRGTIASINWAAREGRPDASASASILASCFPNPTVANALEANKVVHRLKATSVTLRIHSIEEKLLRHVLISDSAFDPTGKTKPQHGWLQGITDPRLNQGQKAPISLIAWRSRRLRRKAGSTMLCESISYSSALGALEKQIAVLDSFRLSRYNPRDYLSVGDDPEFTLRGTASVIASESENYNDPLSVCIVDAKSLYDAASSEQAAGEDDRSALEIAMVQDSLSKVRGRTRWIPHNSNPADMLTKMVGAHEAPMMKLLKENALCIQSEETVLSAGRQGEHRLKTRAVGSAELLGPVLMTSRVQLCVVRTATHWLRNFVTVGNLRVALVR